MNAQDVARIVEAEKNDVITRNGITLFWGGWASQWYPSAFTIDGIAFNCAEQYMMWSKAKFFGDTGSMEKILEAKWPKAQKELGRKAGPWNPEWDGDKGSRLVVLKGNIAKFGQNEDLREKLLATGNTEIGEASPYDKVWGIGFGTEHPEAWTPSKWTGTNWLGNALMEVRYLLQAAYQK
jgi:hypothetical protein